MMEILEATLKLGLPVTLLSWFIFRELYGRGELDPQDKPQALANNLKRIKQQRKQDKHIETDYLQRKWMRFGGGFYGIAALWTFVAIEANELSDFLSTFPGFASLMDNGLINLVVALLVNQITNFVTAMVWFSYWGSGGQSIIVWMGAAYAGYLLGSTVAQRYPTKQ